MGILILTINRIADTQDQDVGRNFTIVPYLRHLDVDGRHLLPVCGPYGTGITFRVS
jgi:hypothetical protein